MRGAACFPNQMSHLRAAGVNQPGYVDAQGRPFNGSTDVVGHAVMDGTAGTVTLDIDDSIDWRYRVIDIRVTSRDAATVGFPGDVFTVPANVWPRPGLALGQHIGMNGLFLTGQGWNEAGARNPECLCDSVDTYDNSQTGAVKLYAYRTPAQPTLRLMCISGHWYITYWIRATEQVF